MFAAELLSALDLVIGAVTLLAIALLVYHHAGYPIILRLAGRRRLAEPPAVPDARLPRMTVVVPAYNEAAVIAAKIDNLRTLDYPADRLDVVVACDGCRDTTAGVASAAAALEPVLDADIRDFPDNRGKVAVLNDVLSGELGDIVCLTDASALLNPEALRIAAAHFADARVGVVGGTYRFAETGMAGEASYWRYQTEVKRREAALGALIGCHGAGYFFRAPLFRPLPEDTINDDFILPMSIAAEGHRGVYEPRIVATELEVANLAQDQRRRRRIAAGNMQQLIRLACVLTPRHGALAFAFASGKVLRALSPYLMILALAGSLWLGIAGSPLFGVLAVLQVLFYAAVVPKLIRPERVWPKPIELIHYLVAGHWAGLIGGTRYLLGLEAGRWQRVGEADPFGMETHLSMKTRVAKRTFDIVGALVGLSVGIFFAIPVAIAIRLTSPGPIIFRQMRIGRSLPDRTELFMMLKFRSMYVDAEARTGPVWATKNDPRITPVGLFLRKTRLDEIPQLLNVLKGDMSLVGPRPERPGITHRLEDAIPFFAERTYGIRPGITGLAQINQGYDESLDDVRSKVLFDHAYGLSIMELGRWFRTDLHILWKTIAVMVGGRGQ
jgi:lipopolysaccharide/colanic/teichoic acid biosynthesis glycosyltransferase/glycosyltransferase involved in cell wall biosynthesis